MAAFEGLIVGLKEQSMAGDCCERRHFTTRAHVTIVVRCFEGGKCVCLDFELKVCGRTLGSKTSR